MDRLSLEVRRMWKIYALKDPTTQEIKYIGISAEHDIQTRVIWHMTYPVGNLPSWVEELHSSNKWPEVWILATHSSKAYAKMLEAHYILVFRELGCSLLNIQVGSSLSDQDKLRRSINMKEVWRRRKRGELTSPDMLEVNRKVWKARREGKISWPDNSRRGLQLPSSIKSKIRGIVEERLGQIKSGRAGQGSSEST